MSVTLERARPEDAAIFLALERKVTNARLYGPIVELETAAREIRENTFFFLRYDDRIVGTAAYRVRADNSVYISTVAVDPDYQGRGIARAAMNSLLELSAAVTRIDLVTHPENNVAVKLYRSLGFEIEGRRENYFGDGEPRLILAKISETK